MYNLFIFYDRKLITQVLAEVKKTLNDVEKVLKRNHEGDFSSPCLRSIFFCKMYLLVVSMILTQWYDYACIFYILQSRA